MAKVQITEEKLNSANEYFNKLNEKEYIKILNDFQKEQIHLRDYLQELNAGFELDSELFDDVMDMTLIIWKAFKDSNNGVFPLVTDDIIDKVEIEAEKADNELAKSLGINLDDDKVDLSKLKNINDKFKAGNVDSPEELLKLIEKNNLGDFLKKSESSHTENQDVLTDFVYEEVYSIEDIEAVDASACCDILFDVIKCFDKTINKK